LLKIVFYTAPKNVEGSNRKKDRVKKKNRLEFGSEKKTITVEPEKNRYPHFICSSALPCHFLPCPVCQSQPSLLKG
jgi:hypothetical protein